MGKKNKKGNKGNKRYSTLEQHKLQRKKLIPPFLQIPNFKTISWLNERLPEMLWATFLISKLEREEALEVFRRVAKVLEGTRSAGSIEVTQTGIASLPHDLRNGILQVLSSADNIRNALRPLLLLKLLSPLTRLDIVS